MFVFIKSGSIVISQEPGLTSYETKNNPINFIIALYSEKNKNSTGIFIIDDGISINNNNYCKWYINAAIEDNSNQIGKISIEFEDNGYLDNNNNNLPLIHNITVYGVTPPCDIVL